MNILIDPLPESVMVSGSPYPVYTDFRVWVRFEIDMLDGRIPPEQKAIRMLALCYKELPPTFDGAIEALIGFYAGGKTNDNTKGTSEAKAPIYSFEYDADYIYAAFLSQYGIDLTTASLHWWKFKALFSALNDTNMIVKIMEYRSVDLGKIKDREQRAFYRKMKSLYKLPDLRTEEEKERAIAKALEGLF